MLITDKLIKYAQARLRVLAARYSIDRKRELDAIGNEEAVLRYKGLHNRADGMRQKFNVVAEQFNLRRDGLVRMRDEVVEFKGKLARKELAAA